MFKEAFIATIVLSLPTNYLVSSVNAESIEPNKGISGDYTRNLIIGIDSENKLTGYYENYSGWDEAINAPRFSCIFSFTGTWQGDRYQISSQDLYGEETIKGKVSFSNQNDRLQLNIKLDQNHGGCWNVQSFDGDRGANFTLEKAGQWQQVTFVSASQVSVYEKPNQQSPTISSISKNEIIKIFNTQDDWLEIEFENSKIIKGWILKSAIGE